MAFFVISVAWIVVAFIAARIADNKGRSYSKTLFLGLVFSPLVSLLVAFALSPNAKAIEQKQLGTGFKKCPACAELIKVEALICRFCQKEFPPEESLENQVMDFETFKTYWLSKQTGYQDKPEYKAFFQKKYEEYLKEKSTPCSVNP